MADIRIKDLAVTAGSSASDDYLAVDGSTNGTRKLSAYSPTFGGNLTVSGTMSVNGNCSLANNVLGAGTPAGATPDYAIQAVGGNPRRLLFSDGTGYSLSFSKRSGSANTDLLTLTDSGNATVTGNLSVSGTGLSAISGNLNVAGIGTFNKSLDNITTESDYAIRIKTSADDGGLYLGANSTISAIQAIDPGTTFGRNLAIQSQGGNVLIGTTSNTGQKLQVNGTAYVSGDATFAGTVTATQFKSATGSVSATNSNATTLFSLSGISGQLLMVHVYINVGDAANYAAYATIVMDGSAARIVSNNASLMTITLSGANVQATQNSGVTQSIIWKYTSV